MKSKTIKYQLAINKIPTLGIILFAILFFHSSKLYPGGSQANINSEGFDWVNNYWCNLMSKKGMNGEINSARPFAISAMIILCGSISIFFYQFAEFLTQKKSWKILIKLGGVLSMIFATLMFTNYHDLMTIISSFFGLIAMIGIVREVYGSSLIIYKVAGIICLLLLGVNNLIYYSTEFIEWLPLIQKITFLVVLIWISGINIEIRKKIKIGFKYI